MPLKHLPPNHEPGAVQVEVLNFNEWFDDGSLAYFIGVSNYADSRINNLNSPENDIKNLAAVLSDKTGHSFAVKDVQLNDEQHTVLSNPLLNPVKSQVLDFVRNISAGEDSRVIVYFACHGIAEKTDEDGNPEGFLLASDAELGNAGTYIRMSDVHDALCALPCRHLLIILDCCYAGAFRWTEIKRGMNVRPSTVYYQKFVQYVSNKARQVITSTSADQQAVDFLGSRGDAGQPVSPFAQCLINAFSTGDADYHTNSQPADGMITVTDLGLYVRENLNNLQLKQIPAVWNIGTDTRGEFIFLNPEMKKRIFMKLATDRRNPYRGLDSYSTGDKDIFYGRERALRGWQDGNVHFPGLVEIVAANNIILVTGRSGVGKSSLVKAGILSSCDGAAIKQIKPGPNPYNDNKGIFEELDQAAARHYLLVDQYEELITNCNDDDERNQFENRLRQLSSKHKILLTLRSDFEIQFKKSPLIGDGCVFFRFAVPPFTRDDIKDIVTGVAGQQALEFKAEGSYTGDEGAKADTGFIDRIIDDTYAYPDSLPLLSLALSRLFDEREADAGGNIEYLMEARYNSFKGISGIIEEQAEAVYSKYKSVEGEGASFRQKLMMQLLFRMISFEAAEITKRRVYKHYAVGGAAINELDFKDAEANAAINAIGEDLVAARLLKTDKDEQGNEYIEPAHDALLRSWPRLTGSLKDKGGQANVPEEQRVNNRDKAVLLRQVSELARQYFFAGQQEKKDLLWIRDYRLHQVQVLNGDDFRLNRWEEDFINASARRRRRNRLITRALVAVALTASISVSIVYIFLNDNIQNQLARSYWNSSLSALGENDQLKSFLFLSEAVTTNKDEAMNKLMESQVSRFLPSAVLKDVVLTDSSINSFVVSKDEKLVLTLSDSLAALWNIALKRCIYTVRHKISEGHLNTDASYLYIRQDSAVECWDIHRSQRRYYYVAAAGSKIQWNASSNSYLVDQPDGRIFLLDAHLKKSSWMLYGVDARLSDNGKRLAAMSVPRPPSYEKGEKTGYLSDSVKVWNLEQRAPRLLFNDKNIADAAYPKLSPSGKYLVLIGSVYGGSKLVVINTENGKLFTTNYRYAAKLAEFSPTEGELFFADDTGDLLDITLADFKVFNMWDPRFDRDQPLGENFEKIHFFSTGLWPYRDSLLVEKTTGSGIWNIRTRAIGSRIGFNESYERRLYIDSIGRHILVLSGNGHLRICGFDGRLLGLSFFMSGNFDVKNLSMSADGKTMFCASGRMIYVYDLFNLNKDLNSSRQVRDAFFSGDGKFSVTIDGRNRASLLENHNGEEKQRGNSITLTKSGLYDTVKNLTIENVVFSEDSQHVLARISDSSLYLIDFYKGDVKKLGKIYNGEAIFVDKRKMVMFVGSDKYIQYFNMLTGATRSICRVPDGFHQNIWLAPDGNSLIAANENNKFVEFSIIEAPFARSRQSLPDLPVHKEEIDPTFGTHKRERLIIKGAYVDDNRFLMVCDDYLLLYNVKTRTKENEFKTLHAVNSINDAVLSNDHKKLILIYDQQSIALLDVHTGAINFSIKLDDQITLRNSAVAINQDGNQLILLKRDTVEFIDVATGKKVQKPYASVAGANTALNEYGKLRAVFDGYSLHYFDSAQMGMISADMDMPPALFRQQAMALTGSRLNKAANQPEGVPQNELPALLKDYEERAEAHYKVCKYRPFNIWGLRHPMLAAKY